MSDSEPLLSEFLTKEELPAEFAARSGQGNPSRKDTLVMNELNLTTPLHDKDMARDFLTGLDPSAGKFTFQFFRDGPGTYAEIFHGTLDEVWAKVQALNTPERGVGVFVTINETDFKGRRSENIVRPRALFADADSNEQIKRCMGTIEACEATPSMIVKSGRGLHFYYVCSDIPRDQFSTLQKSLIDKLGTDPAVKDLSRVMRLPGTLHLKDPTKPRLVKFCRTNGAVRSWNFSELVEKLGLYGSPEPASGVNVSGFPFKRQNPASAFASLDPKSDSLSAGIERRDFRPLPLEPLMKECAFIREAIETGGEEFSQTEWMYTTLISTWLEDGDELAHRMGHKHSGYFEESTDELLDRKKRERREKGLGWPSCRVIRDAGCKHCKECPHFSKGKSPLHLALPSARADLNSNLSQAQDININPVAALMKLRDQRADINTLLAAMNQTFAVVKYGSKIMVAFIIGKELDFMKLDDFHNMLANLVVQQEIEVKDDSVTPQKATRPIVVSQHWFKSRRRRQYLHRGVVFQPGGPPEIPNDMLNLWRGFGVEPKEGDWSLMRNHIRDVICSGNAEHFQYLINWMAYGVQHPDRPIGVAIALRGEEGAGKGFLWRNYGKLFGKHFKHVAHGEHLTGRFNAVLAEASTVFLDEALWAGDRKGEQILKALVTEDTFQLERKFCDPIPVKNCLRIVIASNNQWIVPVSTRGRRYCVLDASNQYADENDPAHAAYWEPLQAQFGDYAPDDGRAAMLYDLLHMDLSDFNVRAVPQSAAKTEQKLLTQTGTEAWLFEILQDGAVTKSSHGMRHAISKWDSHGMQISVDDAYDAFLQFSQERREYKPRSREWWSRDLRKTLTECVSDGRPRTDNPDRKRLLTFRPLKECRAAYGEFVHADDINWEPLDEPNADTAGTNSDDHIDREHDETDFDPDIAYERDKTDVDPDIDRQHDETDFDPDIGWEHDETDTDPDIGWEHDETDVEADEPDAHIE